jgi:hypothetical protein
MAGNSLSTLKPRLVAEMVYERESLDRKRHYPGDKFRRFRLKGRIGASAELSLCGGIKRKMVGLN